MRSMPKLIFNKPSQLRTKQNNDFQLKLRAQMSYYHPGILVMFISRLGIDQELQVKLLSR